MKQKLYFSLLVLVCFSPRIYTISLNRTSEKTEKSASTVANFYNFNIQNSTHTISLSTDLQSWLTEHRAQAQSFVSKLAQHKYLCGFSGICVIYSYISYELYYLQHNLQKPESWSLWRSETSLEKLFEIQQKELGQQLLIDVQQRYTSANNPADFVRPLMLFMQSTNQEASQLTKYNTLVGFIEKLKATRLFFYNKELYRTIDTRLKRLAYFKSAFISWLAQYKIDKSPYRSPRVLPTNSQKSITSQRAAYWNFFRMMS